MFLKMQSNRWKYLNFLKRLLCRTDLMITVMLQDHSRIEKLLRVQFFINCRGQFRYYKIWQIFCHFGTVQLSLEFLPRLYRGCFWEEAAVWGCSGLGSFFSVSTHHTQHHMQHQRGTRSSQLQQERHLNTGTK